MSAISAVSNLTLLSIFSANYREENALAHAFSDIIDEFYVKYNFTPVNIEIKGENNSQYYNDVVDILVARYNGEVILNYNKLSRVECKNNTNPYSILFITDFRELKIFI